MSNQNQRTRMILSRAHAGAMTVVIGSNPCAGTLHGFTSWKDRSHGAEGSCQGEPV